MRYVVTLCSFSCEFSGGGSATPDYAIAAEDTRHGVTPWYLLGLMGTEDQA
jgi:hypothetical protein